VLSVTTERFRKALGKLPDKVRSNAKKAYELWKIDPYHYSLNFKKIHSHEPVYSVRIGLSYRALGVKDGETLIWFWIGTHEEYNSLNQNV
jgi:mRNA-degrading endonuclease RelE of RelBE toxin-antitoxin system